MATLLSVLETNARVTLLETTASFWTSAELIVHANAAIKDLWGAILDLHEEHFLTIDATNVSLAASTATLSGVPVDTFRVLLIEPRDTTSASSSAGVIFTPKDYNSTEFINARTELAFDPSGEAEIFYQISQAGAPVAAPTINIAPQVLSTLLLRFVYIPTLALLTSAGTNPIPGESDKAIEAWIVAYARAKEREDRSPDPAWLAVYATEKQHVLSRLQPRQEQVEVIVEGMFGF